MADLPDLDRLIAAVVADPSDEPLSQLAAAARVRDELDELTEALLDHFVEQAREAGCSWSQIGSVLGVSKQAAQQRHTATESVARRLLARLPVRRRRGRGALFRRFTGRAKASFVGAQTAARGLRHDYIGTEHLLLGMLRERDCIAAKAMAELGVTEHSVESAVVEIIGYGESAAAGSLPFTPRAKKVLHNSMKEAIDLGHNYIGTEHILLAIVALAEGVAPEILAQQGVDQDRLRPVILRLVEDAA